MATLSIQERKRLRQIGHALNPVVMLGGSGLTENVVEEILRALRCPAPDETARRRGVCAVLSSGCISQLIQTVGSRAEAIASARCLPGTDESGATG